MRECQGVGRLRRVGRGTAGEQRGLSAALVVGLSLAIMAVMIAVHGQHPLRVTWDDLHLGPDDAARIVQMRDLAEGQGWFDLRQLRLGPDAPVVMHWSRLVDGPLVLIRLVAEQFSSSDQAERAAAAVWPLIVTFLWVLVGLVIARQLAGVRGLWCGAILLLPYALSNPEFWPGRVDHHNLQLVLLFVVASALLAGQARPWMAAVAGGAAAVSIAVGLETLPLLAVASAAVAFNWALRGTARSRGMAIHFGLGLAAGLLAAMLGTIPPDARWAALCDQLSLAIAAPASLGGIGLAAIAGLLPAAGRGTRLLAAGGLGVVTAGLAVLAFPQCLGGPYGGFDAELQTALLVVERRSLLEAMEFHPVIALFAYVIWPFLGLLGLLLAVLAAPSGRRFGPALLLAVTLVATALGIVEVRNFRFAMPLSVLGGIYLLSWVSGWRGLARLAQPLAIVALLVLVTPAGYVLIPGFIAARGPDEGPNLQAGGGPVRRTAGVNDAQALAAFDRCVSDAEMAPLAELPPGRILSPTGEGAFLLLKTPHHVIAAPYHRNTEGWRAGFRLDRQDAAATGALLARLDVDYLALCPERDRIVASRTSLSAEIARGRRPPWLTPLPGGAYLKIYRVSPIVDASSRGGEASGRDPDDTTAGDGAAGAARSGRSAGQ